MRTGTRTVLDMSLRVGRYFCLPTAYQGVRPVEHCVCQWRLLDFQRGAAHSASTDLFPFFPPSQEMDQRPCWAIEPSFQGF